MNNYLYLGDCLDVLQDDVKDETVDLIYIDPPFNSKRNYNVFFDDKEIHSQRIAFEDTWSLKNVGDSLQQLHIAQYDDLYNLLKVYQKVAPQVFPYLVMMALRIVELHRVLKPTGSFYLHCDPTASHYLKTICDATFGASNFRNEIVWKRAMSKTALNKFGVSCDRILFYGKTEQVIFNPIYLQYDDKYVKKTYCHQDEQGEYALDNLTGAGVTQGESGFEWRGYNPSARNRHWAIPRYAVEQLVDAEAAKKLSILQKLELLYEHGSIIFSAYGVPRFKRYINTQKGLSVQDLWGDINPISSQSNERLGYPTQKPKALLERIIQASSNENDLILDAFCGCGTTIDAAEGLKRRWIGIDISPFALSLIKLRLRDTYKGDLNKFEIRGIPTDEKSAIKLWEQNAFAFQDWWITEFEAFSSTFGKKGADKGVDGIALYALPQLTEPLRVAFQVKGGEKVQAKDIDALLGAMVVHKCELGVFLTRAAPTKPMLDKAMTVGYFENGNQSYPKLQILTLAEFFTNLRPKLPSHNVTFKSAATTGKGGVQKDLL